MTTAYRPVWAEIFAAVHANVHTLPHVQRARGCRW